MSDDADPVVGLSALVLPEDCGIRRLAPRPPALQHESYPDKFDALSVIYDLFRTDDPCTLIAICPPFFNLLDDLAMQISALPDGTPCPFRVDVRAMTERLVITVPEGCAAIRIDTKAGCWDLTPAPSLTARFAGARAIMTLSQDNDLQWIRDWVVYHAHAQGATAAVIYDNASSRYTPAELADALADTGVDHAVIPWPFRYGPNDHRMPATRRVFDSNFCQTAMLDHAWQRLFLRADAVVNADIDELIYTDGPTVFDRARAAPGGFLRYTGRWIEPLPIRRSRAPRHKDFWRTLRTSVPLRCEPKWVVAPDRVPPNAQWMVHDIAGMIPDANSQDVSFGHFRGINSAFAVDAVGRRILKRTWASPFKPTREITALRDAMEAAFADARDDVQTRPRSGGQRPIAAFAREARQIAKAAETDPNAAPYWIAQAMTALREFDDMQEVRAHAERAFALAPDDPNAQEVLAAAAQNPLATLERIAAVPAPESAQLRAERACLLAHLAAKHDPARAQTLVEEALAPALPGALLVQARLAQGDGDKERAAALHGQLIGQLQYQVEPLARQRAYYDANTRGFRVYFDPCGLHNVPIRVPLRAQAHLFMDLKRFDAAAEPARMLAAREPFVFVSQMLLARVLRRAGDAAGAVQAAERAAHAARVALQTGTTAIYFRAKHRTWCGARLVEIAQAQVFCGEMDLVRATADEIRALGQPGRQALTQLRALLERHPKGKTLAAQL